MHHILLRLCKPVCKPENRMSETIKVLCYKSKTLSNGEHPLMLCVCKDRKRKFQSLGISIRAELWDFKANQPPKAKCPNRERIILLINEKINNTAKHDINHPKKNKSNIGSIKKRIWSSS